MSLSWLELLTVLIHPQRVELDVTAWRGRHERLTAPVPPAAVGDPAWQPALDAGLALLAARARPYGSVRFVVANPFVRYALLPWSDVVLGNKARLALARALLRNSLGEQAEQLEIALDRPAFGMNGLAAGIHRELVAALRRAAAERRLHLAGILPRLAHDLAACRKTFDDGCLAFPGDGWLTLLGVQRGNLRLVRNHRAESDPARLEGTLLGILSGEGAAIRTKTLHLVSPLPWPAELGEWRVEQRNPCAEEFAHA